MKRNMKRKDTDLSTVSSSKSAKQVSIFELSQYVRKNTIGIEQVTPPSWFQSFQGQEPSRELLFAKLSVPDELLRAINDSGINQTLIDEYDMWSQIRSFIKNDQIESSCRFIIFKIEIIDGMRRFSIRKNYEANFMTDNYKSTTYQSIDGLWQSNLFFNNHNIDAHSGLIAHLIALMNQQLDLFGNEFTYPLIIAFDYYQNRREPINGERTTLHQDSIIYNEGTRQEFKIKYIKLALLFKDPHITRGTELAPEGGNNVFSMPVTAGNLIIWKESAFYHETPVLRAPTVFRFASQPTRLLLKSPNIITTERLQPIYTDAMSELTSQHLIKFSTGELPLHKRNFLRIAFYKEGDTNWAKGDWMPYNPVVPTYDPFVLDKISIPKTPPSFKDLFSGSTCDRELVSVTRDPRFLEYTAGGSKIKNRTRKKKTHNTRRKNNKCKNCKKTTNKRTIKGLKYGSKIGGDDRACSLNFNRDFIIYGNSDLQIPLQISY
jgi:hypothetical protein